MLIWLLWWCNVSCSETQGGYFVSQIGPGWCLQAQPHQEPGLAPLGAILGPPISGQFYVPPLLCGPVSPFWAVQFLIPVQWICGCPSICHETNNVQDLLHYLDDYFIVGPLHSLVWGNSIATMIATCKKLGFAVNSEKGTKPATTTNFLGVDIDLVGMEARINPTHLSKTISLLWLATKWSILSLVGKPHFMFLICRPGRAFLCDMIKTSMKAWNLHHRIKLNQEFHRDIDWWLHYLPTWNGVSLLYKSHWLTCVVCQFFTDASNVGFCCYFQGTLVSGWVPRHLFWDRLMSINWRELYAITMALAIWGSSTRARGSWYTVTTHPSCRSWPSAPPGASLWWFWSAHWPCLACSKILTSICSTFLGLTMV